MFEQPVITQYEFVMTDLPMKFNRLKDLMQSFPIQPHTSTLHISNPAYPDCALACLTYHF